MATSQPRIEQIILEVRSFVSGLEDPEHRLGAAYRIFREGVYDGIAQATNEPGAGPDGKATEEREFVARVVDILGNEAPEKYFPSR